MAATYNGKIVVTNYPLGQLIHRITQDDLDSAIAVGKTFGELTLSNMPTTMYTFDDGTEITAEDTISIDEVPANADIAITTEIALVRVS